MLRRPPVAAGRFYSAEPTTLHAEVQYWLAHTLPVSDDGQPRDTQCLMLPHAGHVFCGAVIATTLMAAEASKRPFLSPRSTNEPHRILILCPNHTGLGHPLGIWPEGAWSTPLGDVPVDEKLADDLISSKVGFSTDTASHIREHSIEVLLPFLQYISPEIPPTITPVCIGINNSSVLHSAGRALAQILQRYEINGKPVAIIVSSDMNHYEDQATTIRKDNIALTEILSCNPQGLLDVTRREHITMCGVMPMALALFSMQYMGKPWASLCAHDTSATASGNTQQVVGYAGVRFGWC